MARPISQQVQRSGGPPSTSCARTKPLAAAGPPPAVLLVEDDADFREVISLRLRKQGFDVVEAGDAGSAWHLAHVAPIQAVILDYRLPGIDGKTLAFQLRHDFGRQLLLVAFTSWPIGTLERSALFDAVAEKPDVDAVLASLRPLRRPTPGCSSGGRTVDRAARPPSPRASGELHASS